MDVVETAERWLADDPDPATRRELKQLLDRNDLDALHDRFDPSLAFGTASFRGRLGAGPNRMNRVTVIRATAGLCAWLRQQLPNAVERGICVGFDARRMSREFATDAAGVIAGAGFQVWMLDGEMPTPVLAFSVLETGAAAGVMITGADSPPDYNGYKVFWGNGAQIISSHDEGITQETARIHSVTNVPRWTRHEAIAQGRMQALTDLVERYRERVGALVGPPSEARRLPIAYTALHGVGDRLVRTILGAAGFSGLKSLASQAEPDGRFPTVDFPDPEEPAAMVQVLALAKRIGAELVLANDPDAGRLAVAAASDEGYEALSGNDVGCMLADDLLEKTESQPKRLVISSIVSSPLLGKIAEAHGARWEQTLAGHSWINHRAIAIEGEGYRYIIGYDDALGYGATTFVRDKDGISAALLVADLAARCKARGSTLLGQREAMWRRYGLYVSRQISEAFEGGDANEKMAAVMSRYRDDLPWQIADLDVEACLDVKKGVRRLRDKSESPLELPETDLLVFELKGGHRAMLRPSGTEPKLEYDVDVRIEIAAEEDVDAARQRGNALIDEIAAAIRA
ncbi:MAG: phospho-sugar mutase [Myxococcales bacterium]|nr:phospho-sugar mutase [Myxococcales bacterium]